MKIYLKNLLSCLAIVTVLQLLNGCNNGKDKDGFSKTESGLKYKFIEKHEGGKPQLGDIMEMAILYKTPSDSVLFNSSEKTDSFTVKLVDPTFRGGVEEGFAMMSAGDSAQFKISADSLFTRTFHDILPSYLKPGSLITFSVRMKNILSKSVMDSVQNAVDVEQRRLEFARIDTFLQKHKMDVMPTENGAYMVVTKPGSGDLPRKGDTITVNYTGKLLDGEVFDSSAHFSFVLGANKVIPGWEECMPLLNKGASARMLLPSDLGYGARPYGKLPGYATLVFDVNVMEIARGKEETVAK